MMIWGGKKGERSSKFQIQPSVEVFIMFLTFFFKIKFVQKAYEIRSKTTA